MAPKNRNQRVSPHRKEVIKQVSDVSPEGELQSQEQYQMLISSGPLPDPHILKAYGEVIHDGPERIFQAFEKQIEHRHQMERLTVQSDINRAYLGLWLGFAIECIIVTAFVAIILLRRDAISTVVGGVGITLDLVALAATFVYGSQSRRISSP